jgi:hypothetical protein
VGAQIQYTTIPARAQYVQSRTHPRRAS